MTAIPEIGKHYRVEHAVVALRAAPSTKAPCLGALRKGDVVTGWLTEVGERPEEGAWLKLDDSTRSRLELRRGDAAFMLVNGRAVGLGILLACIEEDILHRRRAQAEELGETYLIASIRQGHRSEVRRLLKARADCNAVDNFGETALMEAASTGDVEVCKLLLEYGADPNVKAPSGITAIRLAEEHDDLKGVFDLWHEKRIIECAGRHEAAQVQELLKQAQSRGNLQLEHRDPDGATALHRCCMLPADEQGAAIQVAQALIAAGSPVDVPNVLGEVPLILAVRATSEASSRSAQYDMVEALLEARATVNASDAIVQETALMEAAALSDPKLVLLLLKAKADVNRRSAAGHIASDFVSDLTSEGATVPSSSAPAMVLRMLLHPEQAASEVEKLEQSRKPPEQAVGTNRSNAVTSQAKTSLGSVPESTIPKATPPRVIFKPQAFAFPGISKPAPPPQAQTKAPVSACGAAAAAAKFKSHVTGSSPTSPGGDSASSLPSGGGAGAGAGAAPQPTKASAPAPKTSSPAAGKATGGGAAAAAAAPPPRWMSQEKLRGIMERYPGFVSAGLSLPPEALAQQWTVQEVELYCGSMGELWPHNRPRPANFSRRPPTTDHGGMGYGNSSAGSAFRPPPRQRPRPGQLKPHCDVLGLNPATVDVPNLRRVYRKLALQFHPDKNPGDQVAVQKFQQMCGAYEELLKLLQ